jgi:hypothetical protein
MAQTAVHKLLSFWTTPSLVVLSPCLCANPTVDVGGTSIRTIPTFVIVLGMVAEIERKFIRER